MTIDSTRPVIAFFEAPASWNVSYITPTGFVCRITLRGENGKDLLEKAGVALTFLLKQGCVPEQKFPRNNKGGETKQCPIHKVKMRHYEKDGKAWFAHQMESGWCCGKKSEAHHD